ncbi:MAG: hypothetical protein HXY38_15325 [Chloroflexi bacterium]|nr:hypothetical protein [Chloroflexota bacterium]
MKPTVNQHQLGTRPWWAGWFLAMAWMILAGVVTAEEWRLVDLEPVATEHGFLSAEPKPGADVKDLARVASGRDDGGRGLWTAYRQPEPFWTDERKIVKEIPADFKLPPGQLYHSRIKEAFAVKGEWVTGVGLWAQTHLMYHWVEYEIPAGATRFVGDLAITDDRHGPQFPQQGWVEFVWSVAVDGRVVTSKTKGIYDQQSPGGVIATLDVPLPADAKRIRFRLQNNRIGIEANRNTELVVLNGKFLK